MIRALFTTAATAAAAAIAYRAFQSGKLDGVIDRFFGGTQTPALDMATAPGNVSRPAPAHPWPVDQKAMAKGVMAD